jgi:general L-amino acid transport system permease protein
VTETGVIKWLRENLFSSVGNGLLTVVTAYVVVSLVMAAAPWFLNGIWDSPSLSACREMLDGRTGACFAVLTERWNQLLFGFKYPSELYWRPTLAFVLLFVAIAPLLFIKFLPRKLLIMTGLYPFIAYWLIWGGVDPGAGLCAAWRPHRGGRLQAHCGRKRGHGRDRRDRRGDGGLVVVRLSDRG